MLNIEGHLRVERLTGGGNPCDLKELPINILFDYLIKFPLGGEKVEGIQEVFERRKFVDRDVIRLKKKVGLSMSLMPSFREARGSDLLKTLCYRLICPIESARSTH